MASIKVAVRVRPMNKREINMDSKCIIEMDGKRTSILNSKMQSYGAKDDNDDSLGREKVKDFFFDHSYWSFDDSASNFTSQSKVYDDLGTGVVQSADEGYNACIFAYGQTGSGKTHTMMGQQGNEGLIPRICENLFQQIRAKEEEGVSFRTEVSYLEIYNEKVRDLLRAHHPKSGQPTHTLKVREHPKEGPYVQGLTKHLVSDYSAVEAIMKQGNELRTTASTKMNDTSSRSHAIFTLSYTQAKFLHNMPSETTSKINLVDLAGSERADATGATGVRLKEGGNINKSLVTLGSVISSLAEASTNAKKKNLFIPYRDSVLTWLLKDSLGGNSKTIMIAAISPADCNYAETLSTLRYANRAKNIINKPTVNEDVNVKLIRELRAEIEKLKSQMSLEALSDAEKAAAKRLHENEERLGVLTDKWKDRWKETQKIMQDRELAFKNRLDTGIRMESELPHLVALEDDLLSTGILLYHIKEGKTFVGTENSKTKPDIVINSPNILEEHCVIRNSDGYVVLEPFSQAACSVNGVDINKKIRLQQGDVVILGKTSIFRFNHPKEAEELREKRKSLGYSNLQISTQKFKSESNLLNSMNLVDTRDRQRREEALSKQLEEARILLDKQKQEEERRVEETRNEFTRQIREESRRLQETRAELERQRRARLQEAHTPAQIKKHLEELEKRHLEAEKRRHHRVTELKDQINQKESLISEQEKKLKDLHTKCDEINGENTRVISKEIELFNQKRSTETKVLKAEIRGIVDRERNNTTEADGDNNVLEELHERWLSETERISEQEMLCSNLSSELYEFTKTCDNSASNNISDEEKLAMEEKKEELSRSLSNAQSVLEEMCHEKSKSLRKYQQDFKNRFEIMTWEHELVTTKISTKKALVIEEKDKHMVELNDAQSELDEVKIKYFNSLAEQNEKISNEKSKVDHRKKEAMKKSIDDQRQFNNRVQQYRQLLRKGQDDINRKNQETELMRQEITELMRSKQDNAKLKIEALRIELNDKIENIHELENNHQIVKKEEEKVIQSMLKELNAKKLANENEAELTEKVLIEFEKMSREEILLLQEDVDSAEKNVLQCKSDVTRDDEKLKDIDKAYEEDLGKLDTELLYVAYLVEKEFQSDENSNHEYVEAIQNSKETLENINVEYKKKLEGIQKNADSLTKELVEHRQESQVILEDLVRARSIAEVTVTELENRFKEERMQELEQIELLRERLLDFEEERKLSNACSENEIYMSSSNGDVSVNADVTLNEVLLKEKQRLEDEMYEKILTMERVMQSEIDQLKKREMELIQCLQQDRGKLVDEKVSLEKTNDVTSDKIKELESLVLEKDAELAVTRTKLKNEVDMLHDKLSDANREIFTLQEKLEKYVSMTSLTLANHGGVDDDEELSDSEVNQLLIRVNESNGIDEEDEVISRMRISPPPTPVHRFLRSVNTYKRNQIRCCIPKFVLRGMGRNSYHVFEVKLNVGDEHWAVYRRYRRFRELHRQIIKEYPTLSHIEFPSKRYFGNRAETFVRVRRAQLEAYLTAFIAVLSNTDTCPIYAISDRQLTKQDLGLFHPFFKQGIYEFTREYAKEGENEFLN